MSESLELFSLGVIRVIKPIGPDGRKPDPLDFIKNIEIDKLLRDYTPPWTPMPIDLIIRPRPFFVIPPSRPQPFNPIFPWVRPIIPGIIPWDPPHVIPWTPTVLRPIYIMPTEVIRSINPKINIDIKPVPNPGSAQIHINHVIERAAVTQLRNTGDMRRISGVVGTAVRESSSLGVPYPGIRIPALGTIKIDTGRVGITANELNTIGNNIENELNNIFTDVSRLDSSWNGQASNNAFSKFNIFKSKYNSAKIKEVFDQYIKTLNVNVKTDYEGTETTNQNLSSLFR